VLLDEPVGQLAGDAEDLADLDDRGPLGQGGGHHGRPDLPPGLLERGQDRRQVATAGRRVGGPDRLHQGGAGAEAVDVVLVPTVLDLEPLDQPFAGLGVAPDVGDHAVDRLLHDLQDTHVSTWPEPPCETPVAEPGWREQSNALTCGKTGQGIVEVAGIEPASSGFSIGLLRAQPVVDCRDPLRYRRQCGSVSD